MFSISGLPKSISVQMVKIRITVLDFLSEICSHVEPVITAKSALSRIRSCENSSTDKIILSETVKIDTADLFCKCWSNEILGTEVGILKYLLTGSVTGINQPTVHLQNPAGETITLFISSDSDSIYQLLLQTSSQSLLHELKLSINGKLKQKELFSARHKFSQESVHGLVKNLEKIEKLCGYSHELHEHEGDLAQIQKVVLEYKKLRVLGDTWR
ncbi:uncharacterized protein LOC141915008 [Tubulanus polymorphus]|uniref:uncharacterized protein LOC141915008 n=1 Tax=Tubulanus polymorphus TaxID=672921 RepID=UPI003DA20031